MAPRKPQIGASGTASTPPATRRSSALAPAAAKRPPATPRKPRAAAGARTSTPGRAKAPRADAKAGAADGRRAGAPVHRWWIVPVIVAASIGLFAWAYYPVAAVQYRETREAARLRAELAHLTARNDRLRGQVDRLKTPAGVEDYARSQLGMVKKGENVVVVVDGNEASEASRAAAAPRIDSDEAVEAPVGPWTAFLDLVFGIR